MSIDGIETNDETLNEPLDQDQEEQVVEQPQDIPEPEVTEEPDDGTGYDNEDATQEETAPEANELPEWINDDVRALAGSYGIEEEDLAGFESGLDFHRACRILDKTLTRGHLSEQTQEEAPEETVAPPASETASEEEDFAIDPSRYADYDDETQHIVKVAQRLQEENKAFRGELENMNRQMREEFDRIHRERQEAIHDMELSHFHEVMDGMDENLFGGKKKLTEEADSRREAVFNAYKVIVQSLPRTKSDGQRPQKAPPMDVLVRRAAMLAFGDEMLEAQRKDIYGKIASHSRGRRPSPSKNKIIGTLGEEKETGTIRDEVKRIANSPEISALFDKYQEENGNAPN